MSIGAIVLILIGFFVLRSLIGTRRATRRSARELEYIATLAALPEEVKMERYRAREAQRKLQAAQNRDLGNAMLVVIALAIAISFFTGYLDFNGLF